MSVILPGTLPHCVPGPPGPMGPPGPPGWPGGCTACLGGGSICFVRRFSHAGPVHPTKHLHVPSAPEFLAAQIPWPLHPTGQGMVGLEQSLPLNVLSHWHSPVDNSQVPRPLQSPGHSLDSSQQSGFSHPPSQSHAPVRASHFPWPPQTLPLLAHVPHSFADVPHCASPCHASSHVHAMDVVEQFPWPEQQLPGGPLVPQEHVVSGFPTLQSAGLA